MRAAGSEQGQVAALLIFCLIALLGLSALVIDAGVWFQAKRGLQAQVDAAALAGAQGLPDTSTASALARQYAMANGADGDPTITFPGNGSVSVSQTKPMEGIFSRVLGVLSVNVGASAVATVKPLLTVPRAIPVAVSTSHPDLSCGDSCFGQPATIKIGPPFDLKADKADDKHDWCDGDCEDDGDLGYATLISLAGKNKKVATLAGLIQNGFGKDMGLGNYKGLKPKHYHVNDEGKADKNTALMLDAFGAHMGEDMTLPVYAATYKKQDGDADDNKEVRPKKDQYTVVGWIGFKLDGVEVDHDKLFLHGEFQRIFRSGAEGDAGQPDYSAASIDLTS
jgi:Flp pilus assembly protein TadG